MTMWTERLLRLLDPIYRREIVEDEISEEMRFHIDRRIEDNLAAGMTRPEAKSAALQRFGDMPHYRTVCREIHRIPQPNPGRDTPMTTLLQDISYGFRTLVRSPAFTLIAVVTLALGIGANTAIFSVINTVLLEPLPYGDADRLHVVWGYHPEIGTETASLPDFTDWREQNEVFADMAASTRRSMNLTGDGDPERLIAARVTANLFSVLGLEPLHGRAFAAEEDQPGGGQVVILSHGLWERRFGSRQDVLGQSISLDSEPYTVVGITSPGFEFPSRAEVWLPLAMDPTEAGRRSDFLTVVGRLAPDVTLGQAQSAMDTIMSRLEEQYPQTNSQWGAKVISLHEELVGDVRPTLLALWGAVGFVLLIACANVANLLLARAVGRDELAVRAALGAGRMRLLRQLLTESALLFLVGGLGGLALGYSSLRLLIAFEPGNLPRIDQLSMDGRVAAFTLGLALFTGLVFGLAPAIHAVRHNLFDQLREGGTRASSGRGGRWMRNSLVIGEIALSLVLLIGAGLMIRSLAHLQQVSPGFTSDGVLTMRLSLPRGKYQEPAQVQAFHDELLARTRSLPGVASAAAMTGLYIGGGAPILSFNIEGAPAPPPDQLVDAHIRAMTPGLHSTLEIPLLTGETFGSRHHADAPRVALINQALARRYFPDISPIGQRLAFSGSADGPDWREIIGVVGDVKQEGLDIEVYPEIQVSLSQSNRRSMTLIVKTDGDPTALSGAIRSEVQAMDANQPIFAVQTLDEVLSGSLGTQRFGMVLFSVFAAVALLLAAVGIYSVMSYSVGQRTREIGVRMAMGARPGDVMRMVVGKGMLLTFCGLSIGLGGAFFLTRFLKTLLFEVEATDPVAFGSIAVLLALVALLACYLPARRAMRIDPIDAVRYE